MLHNGCLEQASAFDEERLLWKSLGKLYASKLSGSDLGSFAGIATFVCCAVMTATIPAAAEVTEAAAAKTLTFQEVENAMRPITMLVTGPIYFAAKVFEFVTRSSSAAILVSAISAGFFAYMTILSQRSTTRLRETFNTINRDNWDKDVIAARELFGKIKRDVKSGKENITDYCVDNVEKNDEEYIRACAQILTVMNDYENLALGVRHNIINEEFLFRWMRGTLLDDWKILQPLVTQYRQTRRVEAFIEFEGMAIDWDRGRKYRKSWLTRILRRRLQRPNRRVSVN